MRKSSLLFCFIVLILSFLPSAVRAQEFKTDYAIQYFLSNKDEKITAEVRFNITITHLRSDTYVKRFSLSYPKSFQIHDLTAFDDRGAIAAQLSDENGALKIELEFTNPTTGKGSSNTFYLNFKQDNLFKINGNIWEVIIPLIENRQNDTYQVIVNLSEATDKKISLAKPKPDVVTGRQIVWNNPQTRTIYAVFGDTQRYKTELAYHLLNPKVIPVYTDVAFPPDTLYQKTYVSSIRPAPNLVFTDEDGNYMGRYFLKPAEKKTIVYTGMVEVMTKPREDFFTSESDVIERQKGYLLTETDQWKLSDMQRFEKLSGTKAIYDFVVNSLRYDYKKVGENNHRLGADRALREPTHAVCLEFTDLFVALAREKGILAREVQGFGFSQDETLRPLSFLSDILHSWPEYYDEKSRLWIPVDPTWENTSGIDYYTSLDLNHIAFAIHGKKSDYPYPAGMYKEGNSQDVSVKPSKEMPIALERIVMTKSQIPNTINDSMKYKASLWVKNTGSVMIRKIPIRYESDRLLFSPSSSEIQVLVPYEEKEVTFYYSAATKGKPIKTELIVKTPYGELFRSPVAIVSYYWDLALKALVVVVPLFLLFMVWKRR